MSKNSKFKISPKRFVAVFSCVFVLSFGVAMAASPDIRNSVSEFFQNIFTVEKQGNSYQIVEKSADQAIISCNAGVGYAAEYSDNELAERIGFKPFLPTTIGTNSMTAKPITLGINITGKSSEIIPLCKDVENLKKCFIDDPALNNLKEYNPIKYLSASYSNNGKITYLNMSKIANNKSSTSASISNFDYKGIRCSYIDDVRPDFQTTKEGISDISKMPKGIEHIKHITFDIGGVQFLVTGSLNDNSDSEYNSMVQFTKDYIDAYMSNK